MKSAIHRAEEEARRLSPDTLVSPRHLLVSVLRDPECVATHILLKLGVRFLEVCDDVLVEPDLYGVQETESTFAALVPEGLRRAQEIDHILSIPTCSVPADHLSLDLPNMERSLGDEGCFWRFLSRQFGFRSG